MECEQVVARLWEYLDHQLGPEEARLLQAHLRWCAWCHGAYRCDREFLRMLARQRTVCRAPVALGLRIRARLSA
jgi:mycothiol system anti-sigma-R factor